MRSILCAAALVSLCSVARSERIVESSAVIYREATDDYLFRVVFSYEPDLWTMTRRNPPATVSYPDTHFGFVINSDAGRQLGAFNSMDVPQTDRASLYDWRSAEAAASPIARIPFNLDGNVFSSVVPRSLVDPLGVPELFRFSFFAEHVNFGEHGHSGIVALNTPEPSTLVLAVGSALTAIPIARAARRRPLRMPSP